MTSVIVRYKTRPDRGDENQRLIENVFAELARSKPAGLHYASFRLADGVSFMHVSMVDGDGPNPLSQSAAFAEFQREIAARCVEQPLAQDAVLVGSFGFLDTAVPERTA